MAAVANADVSSFVVFVASIQVMVVVMLMLLLPLMVVMLDLAVDAVDPRAAIIVVAPRAAVVAVRNSVGRSLHIDLDLRIEFNALGVDLEQPVRSIQ